MSNRKKQSQLITQDGKAKPSTNKPTKAPPARKPNIGLFIGIGVVGLLIALMVMRASTSGLPSEAVRYADLGVGLHLKTIDDPIPTAYNSDPPTSGWHVGSMVAPWGIQAEPVVDKVTVHNLEHGGVIIHYRPDMSANDLASLTTLARDLQRKNSCLIVAPRDNLAHPVVITAWTYMLSLDSVDVAKITAFFDDRVGNGPEPFCK